MLKQFTTMILILMLFSVPLTALAVTPALSGTLLEDFSYPDGTLLNTTTAVTPPPSSNWTTGWYNNGALSTPLPADYTVHPQGFVSRNNTLSIYRGFGSFISLNGDYDYYTTWKQSINTTSTNNSCSAFLYFAYGQSSPNANTRMGFIATQTSATDSELVPYLAMQGATAVYGTQNIVKGKTYTIKLKMNSRSSDKTVRAYMKYYADGDSEPADWQLTNSSTSMYGWVFYALGLGGSTYVTTMPITFGGIYVEKYVGLTTVDNAVTNAKTTKLESDYNSALALVNSLSDGMAKTIYQQDLTSVLAYINQQKDLINSLSTQVTAVEAMGVTIDNFNDVQKEIDAASDTSFHITTTDATIQAQKNTLLQRLAIVQKNVYTIAITQTRAMEQFDYPNGTKLNTTTASGNWASGWKADQALTTALNDSVIVNGGLYSAQGNAYRSFSLPVAVNIAKDYYLQFSVKCNSPQVGQWSGISLGNITVGISDSGIFADTGAGKVLNGTANIDAWYNVLLKINGQGRLLYKAWQKSATQPAQWIDVGAVSGTHSVLGLITNVTGTYYDDIIMEQYPSGFGDDLLTEINNAGSSFNQTALNAAKLKADAIVSCLARDAVYAQIAYAQQLIDVETERLNQIAAVNAVVNAENTKTVAAANLAQASVAILTDVTVKDALNQRINVVVDYINQQTPTVEIAAVEDDNGSLKGKYTVSDVVGNRAQEKFKWYSGSTVIATTQDLGNPSGYAGASLIFEVTPLNTAGKEGIPFSSRPYKVQAAGITGSYGGGNGSGGGVHISVITTPPVTPTPAPVTTQESEILISFDDISGHWAATDIDFLVKKGIVKGIGNKEFQPERTVTRAEFLAMIVRALGVKTVEYDNKFTDVKNDDWFASIISTAFKEGFISGEGAVFRPNENISRQEAAKILVASCRFLKIEVVKAEASFKDNSDISEWAEEAVSTVVGTGLMKGIENGEFAPLKALTRAQSAAMLHRLLEKR